MSSVLKACKCMAAGALAMILATTASAGPVWTGWSVGGSTTDVAGTVTFVAGNDGIDKWAAAGVQPGAKSFYSTDSFNGLTVSALKSLSYSGPANGPYSNIFVTNGVGHAVLLVLPTGVGQAQNNFVFADSTYQVFESDLGGIFGDGSILSFDQVDDLWIGAGAASLTSASSVAPIGGWMGAGADDGFALVWGNRGGLAAYDTPVTISALAIDVPEPGSAALVACALLVASTARRRRS